MFFVTADRPTDSIIIIKLDRFQRWHTKVSDVNGLNRKVAELQYVKFFRGTSFLKVFGSNETDSIHVNEPELFAFSAELKVFTLTDKHKPRSQ